jgi:hypothetical protein
MLIVDFSKAFDIVPHIRLLRKLEHYGIKGKIFEWIRAWLTQCRQCVSLFFKNIFDFRMMSILSIFPIEFLGYNIIIEFLVF